MGGRKNKGNMRSNVTYRFAKEQKIVSKVIYEWLKSTHASIKQKGILLRQWQRGEVLLMIDFKNLRGNPSTKNSERDHFLRKYMTKYFKLEGKR